MQACFPGTVRNFAKEVHRPPVSMQVPNPLSNAPDVPQTETHIQHWVPGSGTQWRGKWWVWKKRAHNFAYRMDGG